MSRNFQIYYNAVFGAVGGLLAWLVVGSISTGSWPILVAYAFAGAGIGLAIGALTGAVDGALKRSWRRAAIGAALGGAAGLVSGILGLLIGEAVFLATGGGIVGRTLGWMLLGLFLGVGEGLVNRSPRRIWYGAVGGTIAGAVGGLLYETLTQAFLARSDQAQMIVGALGLILIGASLGAIIPLVVALPARYLLRVRNGARANSEAPVIDEVTLGSYDGCRLYLPGDRDVQPKHARVYGSKGKLFAEDLGGGIVVDSQRLPPGAAIELRAGSVLQLGNTLVDVRRAR
jgi:hypothetical protein